MADKVGGAIKWIREKLNMGNEVPANDSGRVGNHNNPSAGKAIKTPEYNPVTYGKDNGGKMSKTPPEGMEPGYYKKQTSNGGSVAAKMSSNPANKIVKGMPSGVVMADVATDIVSGVERERVARRPENNRSSSYTTPKNTEISATKGKVSIQSPASQDEIKSATSNLERVAAKDNSSSYNTVAKTSASTGGNKVVKSSRGPAVEKKQISTPITKKYRTDLTSSEKDTITKQAISDMKAKQAAGYTKYDERLKELGA